MASDENSIEAQGLRDTKFLAKFFGRSERNIQQLAADKVLKAVRVKGVNYYDLIPSIQSYIRYLQEIVDRRKKTSEDQEREKLDAEIALKRAKSRLVELELNTLELKLLRVEDVQIYTENLAATIKSMLSALPGRLSMDISTLETPAEISAVITKEINSVLQSLAEYEFNLEFYRERLAEAKGKDYLTDGEEMDE